MFLLLLLLFFFFFFLLHYYYDYDDDYDYLFKPTYFQRSLQLTPGHEKVPAGRPFRYCWCDTCRPSVFASAKL